MTLLFQRVLKVRIKIKGPCVNIIQLIPNRLEKHNISLLLIEYSNYQDERRCPSISFTHGSMK